MSDQETAGPARSTQGGFLGQSWPEAESDDRAEAKPVAPENSPPEWDEQNWWPESAPSDPADIWWANGGWDPGCDDADWWGTDPAWQDEHG